MYVCRQGVVPLCTSGLINWKRTFSSSLLVVMGLRYITVVYYITMSAASELVEGYFGEN